MENKRYVVGNLKMSMDKCKVSKYLKVINEKNLDNHVIIFPSSIYVPYFINHSYRVGIQDVYYESSGPFTGETSPSQAKSMGICCTLVGHSERRKNFHETDTVVNKKVLEALSDGLAVILCIGETLEEKELLKTDRVLKKQITYALRYVKDYRQIMIAYEPVWAIGTKVIPSNEEIKKTIQYIKGLISKQYGYDNMKVLYGGSIDDENINTICEIDELDGVLVGNSSTDVDKFLKIIEVVLEK